MTTINPSGPLYDRQSRGEGGYIYSDKFQTYNPSLKLTSEVPGSPYYKSTVLEALAALRLDRGLPASRLCAATACFEDWKTGKHLWLVLSGFGEHE